MANRPPCIKSPLAKTDKQTGCGFRLSRISVIVFHREAARVLQGSEIVESLDENFSDLSTVGAAAVTVYIYVCTYVYYCLQPSQEAVLAMRTQQSAERCCLEGSTAHSLGCFLNISSTDCLDTK